MKSIEARSPPEHVRERGEEGGRERGGSHLGSHNLIVRCLHCRSELLFLHLLPTRYLINQEVRRRKREEERGLQGGEEEHSFGEHSLSHDYMNRRKELNDLLQERDSDRIREEMLWKILLLLINWIRVHQMNRMDRMLHWTEEELELMISNGNQRIELYVERGKKGWTICC